MSNEKPMAKYGKPFYERNLPHIHSARKSIFLTFCTKERWVLPESVRTKVLNHCLYDHHRKIFVLGVVIMPDHVHMVFYFLRDPVGNHYTLAEVTNSIKGASSHSINKMLNRKGTVWQDESFDHVLRSNESEYEKVEYICKNPVRKGLCQTENEYPWLWRESIEGRVNPPK